jgi:thiol-disulfide isomerase/thioredoxin
MKKAFTLLLLAIMVSTAVLSQKATLHLAFDNTTSPSFVLRTSTTFSNDPRKKEFTEVSLGEHKIATQQIEMAEPGFVSIYCQASPSGEGNGLSYLFFVTPGDDMYLKADFTKKDFDISVTGKGSENNQPLGNALLENEYPRSRKDTLPAGIIAAIKNTEKGLRENFKAYGEKYEPTAAFIKYMQYNIDYYAVEKFYSLKENNKYGIEDAYYRNFTKWQRVTDSLFSHVKLDNADALPAYNYQVLIKSFILREKERLWRQSDVDSVAFYKQWYNAGVTEGKKAFLSDRINLVKEKLINKYFTGRVAEFLYASLFEEAFAEAAPENVVAIFDRFKQKYPGSKYISWFGPAVENIASREKNTLNNEMVFAADNGTKLNTLADVLNLTKGKTVLLDMWGTWCGPCRSEIEKNGAAIKEHFKNKGLDYFYIANYDQSNEATWKKLIAFFKLTGTHILANEKLTDDIMKKTNGSGYPTYVVIKKDGSYELSKAGYPMDRDVLIKQLEEALAVK